MFGTIVAMSVLLILVAMAALEFADARIDLRRLTMGPVKKTAVKPRPVVLAPEAPREIEPLPLRKAA